MLPASGNLRNRLLAHRAGLARSQSWLEGFGRMVPHERIMLRARKLPLFSRALRLRLGRCQLLFVGLDLVFGFLELGLKLEKISFLFRQLPQVLYRRLDRVW